MTTRDEVWAVLSDFPDYAVSNAGQIKRIVPNSRNHRCRVLKPWIGNHGYKVVGLVHKGKIHRRLVHRLVCAAFHGPDPSGCHDVAHNDGTRWNNSSLNLRWATRFENMADCLSHGTLAAGPRHGRTTKPHRTPRGERHGQVKLTESDVVEILSIADQSGRAIAAAFGVSPSLISLIKSRKLWSHL